jgi:hypothetical protein
VDCWNSFRSIESVKVAKQGRVMVVLEKELPDCPESEENGRPSIFALIKEGFDVDREMFLTQDIISGNWKVIQFTDE